VTFRRDKEYNDFTDDFTSETLVGFLTELFVVNAKSTMTQSIAK